MKCVCALLPEYQGSGLIVTRDQSEVLSKLISKTVHEELFVFNTTLGVYFFSSALIHSAKIIEIIMNYLGENGLTESRFTLAKNTSVFDDQFRNILMDEDLSSLSWKNFISSFLNQLDPFYGDSKFIHGLFKRFVFLVKEHGNNRQLTYLKKRMNMLRSRVDLKLLLD